MQLIVLNIEDIVIYEKEMAPDLEWIILETVPIIYRHITSAYWMNVCMNEWINKAYP